MNKKKLLILGGTGLLGINWACYARDEWDINIVIHKTDITLEGINKVYVDVSAYDSIARHIETNHYDLIINAAGLTSVDECEKRPELSRLLNSELARNIARASSGFSVPLIHISTDHLFDGKEQMYSEESETNPVNEYGRSKALAEEYVLLEHTEALVIRTNFFGWGTAKKISFSDWILRSAESKKKFIMFNDVFFTPMLIDSLVDSCFELYQRKKTGIYNVTSDCRVSKYDFGLKLLDQFSLPSSLIESNSIDSMSLYASRPKDMSLCNKKLRAVLQQPPGTFAEHISKLYQQKSDKRVKAVQNAVHIEESGGTL